jgi:metal-responsive CopG/Arc/MetJ family transcriptional regulator
MPAKISDEKLIRINLMVPESVVQQLDHWRWHSQSGRPLNLSEAIRQIVTEKMAEQPRRSARKRAVPA